MFFVLAEVRNCKNKTKLFLWKTKSGSGVREENSEKKMQKGNSARMGERKRIKKCKAW